MNDTKKINLDKNAGPVVFLGSMNSMPMMYALELKKNGFNVLYFVDRPESDFLSRPESHFKDIVYPYPSWILEIKIKTQMLIPFFRLFFSYLIKTKVKKISSTKPQLYILNGFFITLAPFFKDKDNKIISLSHGSDLHSWADKGLDNSLRYDFIEHSFYKLLPANIASKLISLTISRQFLGFLKSDKVIYFPKGFNKRGDKVIETLVSNDVSCHGRYDVSFEPLKYQDRQFKKTSDKLVIFSGVRFKYNTFSEGNEECSKGNDIIIKGLSLFYKEYKNIEIHFVEKGPDVEDAKRLCEEGGLTPVVKWHKEMKFLDLLALYDKSDICFDQVGQHWMAAIGAYALWLGKPLIANINLPVKMGIWPEVNPICNASNEHQVFQCLMRLKDIEIRKSLSIESKLFSEKYLGPDKLINEIFEF